ncbi:MAG: zinc transporter ZupT [Clostridia bacterium]|nr:zinc transporter ZupT [Clostridia bacterium]
MNNVLIAFLMALFAGLSTGIGSAVTVFSRGTSRRFMALTLGFSSGVMIYVSLTEIVSKATSALEQGLGRGLGNLFSVLSFFGGVLIIALIGKLIPSFEGENAKKCIAQCRDRTGMRLLRTGLFSAFAIALHNFPEGMATFVSALRDPEVAVPVVVAIAIHNIPEGIAVAAPVYQATGSKKASFLISFLSGLAEPLGALICWALLMPLMSDTLYGIIFAAAAGVMVYICIDEILPTAEKNGHHSLTVIGFILGMAVMAASLLLFI